MTSSHSTCRTSVNSTWLLLPGRDVVTHAALPCLYVCSVSYLCPEAKSRSFCRHGCFPEAWIVCILARLPSPEGGDAIRRRSCIRHGCGRVAEPGQRRFCHPRTGCGYKGDGRVSARRPAERREERSNRYTPSARCGRASPCADTVAPAAATCTAHRHRRRA